MDQKERTAQSSEGATCGTETSRERRRGKGCSFADAETSKEGSQVNLAPYVKPKGPARSCHGPCRACGSQVGTHPCPACKRLYCETCIPLHHWHSHVIKTRK